MAQSFTTAKMPRAVFNPDPKNSNFTTIEKYENHAEIKEAEEALRAAAAREARIRAIEQSEPEQKRAGGGGEFEAKNKSEAVVNSEERGCAWDGEGGFWAPPMAPAAAKESRVDAKYEGMDGAWDGEFGFWKN